MEEEPKPKRQITEKQREARLANLANGRKKRAAMIQRKKEKINYEYDISSEDASCSSDSDDFVISKKKARKKEPTQSQSKGSDRVTKQDFDELRNIVTELAMLQKKNKRRSSSEGRSRGSGTKVIVVPQPASQQQNKPTDDYMEKLRKSIFD